MAVRRAIFISGGGSGIGRAIALRFAAEGWFVGLGDIDPAGMAETQRLIANDFTYAHAFDVRDRTAWDVALTAFATAAGGRIDVLANNAGVPLAGPLTELTSAEIERTLDINLKGAIFGAQAAYPWLKASAPGSCLLNTASAAALYGFPNQSIYGATKAGVRSLTETLDGEWGSQGIKVRSLMPSFIDTPLLQHAPNEGSNVSIRQVVVDAGLEFTPVEVVAQNAWDAVHGDRIHYLVGETAKKLRFAARWMPGKLRKRAKALEEANRRAGG
ncbi:MAG: SDR family oxidoreductase [Candidatus Andeanibacterium colombiense]|uniref:SDR family oxidoreductase n=1 Tax=Candidatus Andeanibacterium colombiense TaxID=3121345 RepID=A0AAJ5X8L1_9SPHN|nr:MAG: SDR family oxidoreductase [Sphingomonadaceae bacterium]